ncbi:MAG: HNH endonuclease [Planctomycetaceae bacterium]|nr:HNH endonuclease [Planctomycetaceae bacterium]
MNVLSLTKARQLTQERLKQVLHYDPKTGIFKWKLTRPGCVAGRSAGTITNGYRQIEIDYKLFRAGRLAWLYMTGEWPECVIDHINGVRNDDRWQNLRSASYQENARNRKPCRRNSSGKVGVHKSYKKGWWGAGIGVNDRYVNLGHYKRKADAIAARLKAEKQFFGKFAKPVSAYNSKVKAGAS